ncbi:hypothetical protein V2J09_004467 [Rumex salicifolius]
MQAGGSAHKGLGSGGGHGRSPASAAASPSSSSSAPHLGFDLTQHQQSRLEPNHLKHLQQHQQLGARQSFQHQLLRKQEANEPHLAFQAGGVPGFMGRDSFASSSSSHQSPQQPKNFMNSSQQHSPLQLQEDGQSKGKGNEQHVLNPAHQAYLQHAYQAAQQMAAFGIQSEQQSILEMGQIADHAHSSLRRPFDPSSHGEKQGEHPQRPMTDQRNEQKSHVQLMAPSGPNASNFMRPMQVTHAQHGNQNIGQNPMAMAAQLQAWAFERNIDLSHPANANLVAQLIPLMQSGTMMSQKTNDGSSQASPASVARQHVTSPPVANEISPRANSSSEVSGQSGSSKSRQVASPRPFGSTLNTSVNNHTTNLPMQQFSAQSRVNPGPSEQSSSMGTGLSSMQTQKSQVSLSQALVPSLHGKSTMTGQETAGDQYVKQLERNSSLSGSGYGDGGSGNHFPPQSGPSKQVPSQRTAFTKQQLHVLKAQILAFRRIKVQQPVIPTLGIKQDRSAGRTTDDNARQVDSCDKETQAVQTSTKQNSSKEETYRGDQKVNAMTSHTSGANAMTREPPSAFFPCKEDRQALVTPVKPEPVSEPGGQNTLGRSDSGLDMGKAISASSDTAQLNKTLLTGAVPQTQDVGHSRKYHGPLFDFPFFTRRPDSAGSTPMANSNNNLTLAYDVKDLLHGEGIEVMRRKREESLKKISCLLALNLERKRMDPDLILRLQIEEKKLKLIDRQTHLRDKIDQEQKEIMAMNDREYRKFIKQCERQRLDLSRQVHASQRALREKQLKSIFQWRKKLLETHWAIRDARTARNRGVAKYHERMLREFSKRKDDDRNKRMEALKNNDMERYREMLLEQQTSIPGDAAERFAVLSTFLSQTEDYLHKLGGKITATKGQQEVEEAAAAAAAAARAQGLSEDEIRAAASCAGEEVMIRNQFSEMNAPKDNSTASKYYTLAHAVNERVLRQPSRLRAGTLRDYQLVGLQWMLSLYNNKLNGILADEMGLGKTVMALIAYLMEFKGNYGPHLIIVPNAVLVNWKSELHTWLPSVSCIYYVGNKEQRSKLFSQEVCAMKFNVLVTTYEFIMFDRSKLSKVDWKYIIIDEAQRMKDRESVLSRDLDRYRCQRRLLLTGTPLQLILLVGVYSPPQNDLKELWSLLNLLLPEVFDNRKAFHDWFSQPFQREGPAHNAEDDWLETEKKVIIIHRLHQILEPFMLRRRVEDVEGSLPPKVSVVLKCKMSAMQGAIYDWIKATGTIRVDPEDEERRVQKSTLYQARAYRTLNNRCMELRKVCNHPLLNYPYYSNLSKDFLVRSCGKLWILDRILIKLQRTGHRVLLFSTMTKLLDILEEYLQWRRLVYRRIDGTTSLEDRESAIVDFNSPNSDCFIFLLSIRAAGRGLNLQSADTVIIYDPDPNPKNEEQAVARAHRIGQTREVRVINMEAVVEKISSHQKADEFRSGCLVDSEDDFAGKDRYIGSIESLIRNNIQQYKIDMADEVINAGRFDQRTTHEERRLTLETLLHDEERYQENVHDVPSLQEVNRMIARSEEEIELFDQMDEDFDWAEDMMRYDQVPRWLQVGTEEVNATIAALSKKPSKDVFTNSIPSESVIETERRGRRKGKKPVYTELDDEHVESSDASSEERHKEAENGDFEDEEEGTPGIDKNQSEEDVPLYNYGYEYARAGGNSRSACLLKEPGSSSDSQRFVQRASPSSSLQKFTSLSALGARPISLSKRQRFDLEDGETAVSGDSHVDLQQSGSWNYDRGGCEDEQVLQPKIKRKRSVRLRPRAFVGRQEDRPAYDRLSLNCGDSLQLRSQMEEKFCMQHKTLAEPLCKQGRNGPSLQSRPSLPARTGNISKLHAPTKLSRVNSVSARSEEPEDDSRGSWNGKATSASTNSNYDAKMSDVIQRRCKNVLTKLRKKIIKEGPQIVPMLADLWRRLENPNYYGWPGSNNLLDLKKIEQRVDGFEYSGVVDLISDVQILLKNGVQYYGFSYEVRIEARKVHDLFFDILKIAFPDSDFKEAKNAVSFAGPTSSAYASVSSPSPRPSSALKRDKLMNEVERETNVPPRMTSPRMMSPRMHTESRLGGMGNNNVPSQDNDESSRLTHPGELVVCKKKRKDREKSVVKTRPRSVGPVSPPSTGRSLLGPPGSMGVQRDGKPTQKSGWGNQPITGGSSSRGVAVGIGGLSVGWANPVKRLRTDVGKRRPSHLLDS